VLGGERIDMSAFKVLEEEPETKADEPELEQEE
jgi:hypothetical protein